MLYIYKGETSTIPVTLSEKATSTTHDWLFEFVHDDTGNSTIVSLTEESSTTSRYSKFSFTEPTDGELEEGSYTYYVYEMAVASPPSTDKTQALATVETRSMKVMYRTPTTPEEFDTSDEINTETFEG